LSLVSSRNRPSLGNIKNVGSVHRWYTSVMGFPPGLVRNLILELKVDNSGWLLDPFCGTGTTLVEAKSLGIPSVGVDSNPFFVYTSWAKTYWKLDPERILDLAKCVMEKRKQTCFKNLPMEDSWLSVVKRGWLRESVAYEANKLLEKIKETTKGDYSTFLTMALVWSVKEWASNVKFGPEAYKVVRRGRISVSHFFLKKILQIASDLNQVQGSSVSGQTRVLNGDSREIASLLKGFPGSIKWVITSPPYPTEHDYTRITRIELELLGLVRTSADLRKIKQMMIRSNSKNVYYSDNDYDLIRGCTKIRQIVDNLSEKARRKQYGFAKQYPRVIGEYFGGLYRHLRSLGELMPRGARCAYVLGEQCSYLGCFIPTASIVAHMSRHHDLPFEVTGMTNWRTRRATRGTRRKIKEQILFLRRE